MTIVNNFVGITLKFRSNNLTSKTNDRNFDNPVKFDLYFRTDMIVILKPQFFFPLYN